MNIQKKFPFIFSILFGSILLGIYQLPNIENILNKYNINLTINDSYPYTRNFQQSLENVKITSISFLDQTTIYELEQQKFLELPKIASKNNLKTEKINNSMMNVNNNSFNSPTLLNGDTEKVIIIDNIVSSQKLPCEKNCKVLMLGDSVMGDVSFAIQRLLHKEKPSWKIIDAHKVSSGLSNQNYYNWPVIANTLIEKNKPDYILILIGTNDAQGFISHGKKHFFGKDDWKNEYLTRAKEMTSLFHITNWSWIELPIVNDKKFNEKLEIIRQLQNTVSKENYIETKTIFDKRDANGSVDMKLRAGDGIHLNSNGANLLAKYIISKKFLIDIIENQNNTSKKNL